MFFRRIRILFGSDHFHCPDESSAGFWGLKNIINVSLWSSLKRRCKHLSVLILDVLEIFFGIFCLICFFTEDDLNCAFGPHYSDLCWGPGHTRGLPHMPAVIHTICSAICFSYDDGDPRYGCFCNRIENFCTLFDNTTMLLADTRKESRHILKKKSGILKASQKRTKRAPFFEALISRQPARNSGWFATMPMEWPFKCTKPTTIFGAKYLATSKNFPLSAMLFMISTTSYGFEESVWNYGIKIFRILCQSDQRMEQ